MASRAFFHPTLRLPLFAAGVGVSTGLFLPSMIQQYRTRNVLLMDSSPVASSPQDWSFSQYQNDAAAPILKKDGRMNARSIRQMSTGSIVGLVAGLSVSMFSKTLAFLIGLAVVGVQTAESYGIHLVPYNQVQKYFKNVNVRSAMQDNVAFKLSFGLMFALSAFAQL